MSKDLWSLGAQERIALLREQCGAIPRISDGWQKGVVKALDNPLTTAQIEQIERTKSFILPPALREYLLEVSSEIRSGIYTPICWPDEPLEGCTAVSANCNIADIDDCSPGMIQIADWGCTDAYYIFVKGNHYGEVWYGCDGETVNFVAADFYDWLTNDNPKLRSALNDIVASGPLGSC